ncbi:MAG: hypothetical protein V3S20_08135 [Dehalococcoidia bacterium]
MRRVLRIVIPVVMVSLGVLSVVLGGWKAAIALIPILVIHVAVALVVIPLWARYRRRRKAARASDGD